jgi:hypothetical protein
MRARLCLGLIAGLLYVVPIPIENSTFRVACSSITTRIVATGRL